MRGVPASPGLAVGPAQVPAAVVDAGARHAGDTAAEVARAESALRDAGAELEATAARLRDAGHGADAEIVEAGALMALDPALSTAVESGIREGLTAAAAIVGATAQYAATIASLPDPHLAARADDVLSLGRRASRLAEAGASPGAAAPASAPGGVVVAEDLGPADVADLQGAAAVALAGGAPTAHAAIVARSLGVPMVVGLGAQLLDVAGGATIVVDGATGDVLVDPEDAVVTDARGRMASVARQRARQSAEAALPAVTLDGTAVRVLTNAAGPAEVGVGLAAGAEGIGLLRTELAFLDAGAWPTEQDHQQLLDAIDAPLITVRLLDFGGDKTPPFLRGVPERGIALLLAHPEALAAQLRAIGARIARGGDVRVLIPLVSSPGEVDAIRAALPSGAQVGAMIETPEAADVAPALARRCAFLSVGTNDLTNATLGTDRFAHNASVAHHPLVLDNINKAALAAHAAGVPLEVCGEAASDPIAMPLLVGLGVDELSVGAARVGTVRAWVRALDAGQGRRLAQRALERTTPEEVADLVRAELGGRLDEAGEELGEPLDGDRRVGALGA